MTMRVTVPVTLVPSLMLMWAMGVSDMCFGTRFTREMQRRSDEETRDQFGWDRPSETHR